MNCTCNNLQKIRIGNTIEVGIEVLTDGEAVSLAGRDIKVLLVDPRGASIHPEWAIDPEHENVVRFVYEGADQKLTGVYDVVIYENKGVASQTLFDKEVFQLVKSTSMENVVDMNDLAHRAVTLSGGSLLVGGKDGVSIDNLEQVVRSDVSLGENVWRVTLSNGKAFDLVAKNGERGEKGEKGEKVNVKRIYKNYEYEDGIQYVIEFTDGSAFPFVSPRGRAGKDGYTPRRGVNYWTEEDQQTIVEEAANKLGRAIPERTSQLENDSDYVSDATYVHTDNNYTTADKTKLASVENGAQVNYVKSVEDYSNMAIQSNYNKFLSQGGITLRMGVNGLLGLMVNTGGVVGPASWGSGTRQFVTGQAVYDYTSSWFAEKDSPALKGTPTAPTPAQGDSSTQIATTEFVTNAVAESQTGTSGIKGAITSNSEISGLSDYKSGWRWLVKTAGTYVGQTCEVGDLILCIRDRGTSYSASDFTVLQANIVFHEITEAEIDAICV